MYRRTNYMLSVVFVLSALFSPSTLAQVQMGERVDGDWRELVSAEGEFAVEFPGAPKYIATQMKWPGVVLTAHIYRLLVNSSVYEVWYGDTAPGVVSAEQRVNGGLAKLLESFSKRGGREVARRNLSISATCKEAVWLGTSPQYPTLAVRAIGTPKHSYFLAFSSNQTGEPARALYRRFFESFKFNGYPCATELIVPLNRSGESGPIGPVGPVGPIGPVSPVSPAPGSQPPPAQNPPGGNGGGGGAARQGNTGGGDGTIMPVPRVNTSGIYRPGEVTKRAMIVARPEPKYTEEARKNMVAGTVRIRLVLTAAGRVADPFVLRGLPYGLNKSALEAARRIKFIPAEHEGRKVSQWLDIEYHFNLY